MFGNRRNNILSISQKRRQSLQKQRQEDEQYQFSVNSFGKENSYNSSRVSSNSQVDLQSNSSDEQQEEQEYHHKLIQVPVETASVDELVGYLHEEVYNTRIFESCSECNKSFKMGESQVVRLACQHHFHKECAHKWLYRQGFLQAFYAVCPKCKQSVFQMQASNQF